MFSTVLCSIWWIVTVTIILDLNLAWILTCGRAWMRKTKKMCIFEIFLDPISSQRFYFLVFGLKLVDKKSRYHLKSKSGLKSHHATMPERKNLGNLANMKESWLQFSSNVIFSFVFKLKLVDNKSDHHLRSKPGLKFYIKPCPNVKTWKIKISRFFRSSMAKCKILG
jgi:hypothetical protein